jgi:hypothetical protein
MSMKRILLGVESDPLHRRLEAEGSRTPIVDEEYHKEFRDGVQ